MGRLLDENMRNTVTDRLGELERLFQGDVAFYYGPIAPQALKVFRNFVESLALPGEKANRLVLLINTPGGSVEVAEKMVEIIRFHYREVFFVVPDAALSAGTILCMSGDKIWMDYGSSLGPIDPQVWNGKDWVPALGYLDKVAQLLKKAAAKDTAQGEEKLSNAEFLILQNQDLAMLSLYEQHRDLTVTLLKKWLAEYKFRDWSIHETDPSKLGQPVSPEEKAQRAQEIAEKLGDNKLWHAHGRMIGPGTLWKELKLKIDDYSQNETLRTAIRAYNDLLTEYIAREDFTFFMHSRNYF